MRVEPAPSKRGDELTLEIDSLAYGGRAVGRHDGLVVFVRGALPGETVRVVVTRRKRTFVEARLVEVIAPSPERVAPFCVHYGTCGSCPWQALDYDAQLTAKRRLVIESLERLGGVENAEALVGPITPSPLTRHHRNKTEFAVSRDRDGRNHIGLREAESPRVFDLTECHLPPTLAARLAVWLRDAMERFSLTGYDERKADGLVRYLVVRHTENDEHMAALVTSGEEFAQSREFFDEMRRGFPELTTAVWVVNHTRATVARGEVREVAFGPGFITETLAGKRFRIGPTSFFQTNTRAAENLVSLVRTAVGDGRGAVLLDLYCGAGAFGILLADMVRSVIGVEADEDAVVDAEFNARENGATNARFETGLAERWLTEHRDDSVLRDAISLVDPPRAGLHPRVVRRLNEVLPPRVVYVSCNPTTLARDVAGLTAAFDLASATPVDMFPHTYHVETVAVFERRSRGLENPRH